MTTGVQPNRLLRQDQLVLQWGITTTACSELLGRYEGLKDTYVVILRLNRIKILGSLVETPKSVTKMTQT